VLNAVVFVLVMYWIIKPWRLTSPAASGGMPALTLLIKVPHGIFSL
jgi:hypothetical protein